jgi:ABC-type bacteriocin/lantibiotic exporter with double-glycine peptidase domain
LRVLIFLFLFAAVNAPAAEIHGVPFVKQDTLQCGPASLASVLLFYGDNIDQYTIGKEIYSDKLKGTLITDLENFARKRGFQTLLAQGTIGELKQFVDKGRPVIVLVDLGVWLVSKPHYLVIAGYTESGFIVHSGYEASNLYGYNRFQRVWDKTGRAFLVVHP